MIAGFMLGLREGLEAALIVGIVFGVLTKARRTEFAPVVWGGVVGAIFVSLGVALALNRVGTSLEGEAEEIFEGLTMLFAAGLLTWMIFWMQGQGGQVKQTLESNVRRAASSGQVWGLFTMSFITVLREGIETALFLTAAAMTANAQETFLGGLAGLLTAVVLGWLLFVVTVRLNVRRFFQITSAFLILFAAGLLAHGVHELNEVGWIPTIVEHVWDLNPILDENSTLGLFLKTLFGYNGNPSLTEVIAYLGYFVVLFLGVRYMGRDPSKMTLTTE
jgi:high-affinity iron transporter